MPSGKGAATSHVRVERRGAQYAANIFADEQDFGMGTKQAGQQ